jgi:hypothetical protein
MTEPADARLDELLGRWAAEQRLGDHEADRILQTIVQPPRPSLPATWWSDLSAQVSAAIVLAATRPGTSSGTVGAAAA